MALQWPVGDPRRGIVAGGDEGDTFIGYYESYGKQTLAHKYSCHSNAYRGIEVLSYMHTVLTLHYVRAD